MIRIYSATIACGLIVLSASAAHGQAYPNRPIRILASEAGGITDLPARIIAQGISAPLGQPVIVENHPGALIGELLAKSTPDGYTLTLNGGPTWLTPLLQKMSYDPIKDFAPITSVVVSPYVLVVSPSLPVKSVKELIALAKTKPGALNYASGPFGGAAHIAPELFKSMADVNIVRIPYKGSGLALNGVIAGDAQMMMTDASSAIPQVKSGKLVALAATTAKPSALLPGLPTIAETLPGYDYVALNGMLAPGRTPAAIINQLNQEIVRVLQQPAVKEKFFDLGTDVVPSTPEQFAVYIKSDMARVDKLIKEAGIHPE